MQLIGKNLGKYQVVAHLGKGGMAQVYKGYQPNLDRYVAIKVLHDHLVNEKNFIARFEREATAIAKLRHNNIVQVYDFDVDAGIYYMVMEFIEGPTLQEEIQKRAEQSNGQPLFSLIEVRHILTALASALDYAHARGIVHRDLKPGNVMFMAEGQVLLTDFGLFQLIGDTTRYTQTGSIAGTPSYMSPEQCRGAEIDTRSDIYAVGIMLYELLTGELPFQSETPFGVILQHLTDSLPSITTKYSHLSEAIEAVISKATAKEGEKRYQTTLEFSQAFNQAIPETDKDIETFTFQVQASGQIDGEVTPSTLPLTQRTTTSITEQLKNPYRGLYAFKEEDAPFFFGREVFTKRLVKTIQEQAMVAVIGPSGSGKSSVVFAGMIPILRNAGNWLIIHVRPGKDPYYALSAGLLPYLYPDLGEEKKLAETRRLAEDLQTEDINFYSLVKDILVKHAESTQFLIISDQFEELFTLCDDPRVQRSYPNMLFQTVQASKDSGIQDFSLAITLRADFVNQALTHRPFADALQDHDVKLGPMNREELASVIESPAQIQKVSFEPGLVDRILDDVGKEPGNLPLLEFALTLLWEKRTGFRLTHEAYEEINRVEGSLARYADEIYAQLSAANKKRARRVFTQMVRPGEGTEDTRRVASRYELDDEHWALANYLADARLVVTGRSPDGEQTVEVVHEALIRGWQQLRQWMNEDRAFRTWQERLRAAMRQWESSGRDEGALLRGSLLAEAHEWLNTRSTDLSQDETDYIEASIALRDRSLAEREAHRQRELEAAQKLADEQKMRAEAEHKRFKDQAASAKRLRILSGVLAVIFIVAVGAAISAFFERQKAENESFARATEVIVRSTAEADARANEALAGTRAAEAIIAQNEAESERNRANQEAQLALEAQAEAETERNRANEEAQLALAHQLAAQSTALVGNQLDLALLLSLESCHINATAESKSSLFAALQMNPRLESFVREHAGNVQDVAFSPDGQYFASTGSDGEAFLFDAATGELIRQFIGHDNTQLVNSVDFSPDGKMLATSSDDLSILLWDVETGERIGKPMLDHRGFVQYIDFSPDGKTLASVGGDGDFAVRLWDVETQELKVPPMEGHLNVVWFVEISPDGRTVASASWDGTVRLWDMETGELQQVLNGGHTGAIFSLDFSTDSNLLATGGNDNNIVIWDLATGQPIGSPIQAHAAPVNRVKFTPDGNTLVSVSADSFIARWDMTTHTETTPASPAGPGLRGHTGSVLALDISPDGTTLVSGDTAGNIIAWNVTSNVWPATNVINTGHRQTTASVAVSPNGELIATGGGQSQIFLWDTQTYEKIGTLIHSGNITSAIRQLAISPNGQILASGGSNGSLILWDILSGTQKVSPMQPHIQGFTALAFSPDGQIVATGGQQGIASIWDANTGQNLNTGPLLTGHVARINDIAISPDGQTMASVSNDQRLILRHISAGNIEFDGQPLTYEGASELISVLFSEDGQWVATGDTAGNLVIWDSASREVINQWQSPTMNPLTTLLFNGVGNQLVVGDDTGNIYHVAWESGELVTTFNHPDAISQLAWADGESTLQAWSNAGNYRSWQLEDGSLQGSIDRNLSDGVNYFFPNTTLAVSGNDKGLVQVWDTDTDSALVPSLQHTKFVSVTINGLAFFPDGQHLLSTGNDGTIRIWDVNTGEEIRNLVDRHFAGSSNAAISPDGNIVVSGGCHQISENGVCVEGEIIFWDLTTDEVSKITLDAGSIQGLTFSPDGSLLASNMCPVPVDPLSGCLKGGVALWDVATGEMATLLTVDSQKRVSGIAFSPDGQLLAAGDLSGSIALWDLKTHEIVGQRLTAHNALPGTLAFHPSGEILASGSLDSNIILWDVETGQIIGVPLFNHMGSVLNIAFSPDGLSLYSVSSDTNLIQWDTDIDSWQERACQIANRNLTQAEWENFFGNTPYRETCP